MICAISGNFYSDPRTPLCCLGNGLRFMFRKHDDGRMNVNGFRQLFCSAFTDLDLAVIKKAVLVVPMPERSAGSAWVHPFNCRSIWITSPGVGVLLTLMQPFSGRNP